MGTTLANLFEQITTIELGLQDDISELKISTNENDGVEGKIKDSLRTLRSMILVLIYLRLRVPRRRHYALTKNSCVNVACKLSRGTKSS